MFQHTLIYQGGIMDGQLVTIETLDQEPPPTICIGRDQLAPREGGDLPDGRLLWTGPFFQYRRAGRPIGSAGQWLYQLCGFQFVDNETLH